MLTNMTKYRSDMGKLISLGVAMDRDLDDRHRARTKFGETDKQKKSDEQYGVFEHDYQKWYTECCALMRQLLPERLSEFEYLYKGDVKRKGVNINTYNIQDWLMGARSGEDWQGNKIFDDFAAVAMRFRTQFAILQTIEARFESSLFDIRQLVQADILDSELDAGRELKRHGFGRAGGAIAGVVLEKHLSEVAKNHGVVVRKKNPNISDCNDALKISNTYDTPVWRQIQRLGDIRNLCSHHKDRDPTNDEIDELLEGVEKATKTVY